MCLKMVSQIGYSLKCWGKNSFTYPREMEIRLTTVAKIKAKHRDLTVAEGNSRAGWIQIVETLLPVERGERGASERETWKD